MYIPSNYSLKEAIELNLVPMSEESRQAVLKGLEAEENKTEELREELVKQDRSLELLEEQLSYAAQLVTLLKQELNNRSYRYTETKELQAKLKRCINSSMFEC